jgi:pimeloyl-ACP methyl ester carboxylesterase
MAQLQAMKEMSLDELMALGRRQNPKWPDDELRPWAEAKRQLCPRIAFNYTHVREPYNEVMARVKCPVLLMTANVALGSNVTAEMAAEARRIWPQTEVVNVPEEGHNIRREGFATMLQAVKDFLRRQYVAN